MSKSPDPVDPWNVRFHFRPLPDRRAHLIAPDPNGPSAGRTRVRFAATLKGGRPYFYDEDQLAGLQTEWYSKAVDLFQRSKVKALRKHLRGRVDAVFDMEAVKPFAQTTMLLASLVTVSEPRLEINDSGVPFFAFRRWYARFELDLDSELVNQWKVDETVGARFSDDIFDRWLAHNGVRLEDAVSFHFDGVSYSLEGFGEFACWVEPRFRSASPAAELVG